jgi:hypothetical protein
MIISNALCPFLVIDFFRLISLNIVYLAARCKITAHKRPRKGYKRGEGEGGRGLRPLAVNSVASVAKKYLKGNSSVKLAITKNHLN